MLSIPLVLTLVWAFLPQFSINIEQIQFNVEAKDTETYYKRFAFHCMYLIELVSCLCELHSSWDTWAVPQQSFGTSPILGQRWLSIGVITKWRLEYDDVAVSYTSGV